MNSLKKLFRTPKSSGEDVTEKHTDGKLPAIEVSAININKTYNNSSLTFKTSKLPKGSLQVEFSVKCHGCHQVFTQKSSHDFSDKLVHTMKRECPHCSSEITICMNLTSKGSYGEGEIQVTGVTHLRNQTPEAIEIGSPTIIKIDSVPIVELALRMSRQNSEQFPIELLEKLDEVNIVDADSVSLLSNLCFNHDNLTVKRAIDKGADINRRSDNGQFPLMAAITSYKIDNVRALLEAGVDVNRHTNNSKVTALHQAVYQTCLLGEGKSPQIAREIVFLLLDHAANPDTIDVLGDTPLKEVAKSFANEDGELKRRLIVAIQKPIVHL